MKRPTKFQLASWILAGLVALGAVGVYAWRAMAPTDPQTEKARRLWTELRGPSPVVRFVGTVVSGQAHCYSKDRSRAIVTELAGLGAAGLPYLRRCLRHKEQGSVRYYAAEELGKMGPGAEEAIPDLTDVLSGSDYLHIRFAAAEAVAKIGRPDKGIPLLTKMLRSSDEFDRSAAARVLGNLGPLAEPVIPDLIRALADAARHVRDKASEALARIGPPAVPALMKALEHRDATVREHATWALGEIGPAARQAIPALEKMVRTEQDSRVRKAAEMSLKKVHPGLVIYHYPEPRQVVYVIDRSGSMVDRLHGVKREVAASIGQLKRFYNFHIVLYGISAEGGPAEGLVPATDENKLEAVRFLRGIRAQGQADPVPALKQAFEVLSNAADTTNRRKLIHLLTDGVFPDNKKVLEVIRGLNQDKDVRVYTFLMGERHPVAVEVMKTIAAENGGKYVYVSFEE